MSDRREEERLLEAFIDQALEQAAWDVLLIARPWIKSREEISGDSDPCQNA